jgi:AcrR family transcriptional regulator
LHKTTVEDAAREAGVSRATLYRYFPGGRDELVRAVIAWQYLKFFGCLYEEVWGAASLEEVLERALPFARTAVLEHEVLQRILQSDPDVLLPNLRFESSRSLGVLGAFLAPYLVRHGLTEGLDARRAADFLARMILSLISAPGRWDLRDPGQVADLVQTELLAGVAALRPVVDNET